MSKKIRFKGIVATLAQIAADAFAGRISWASDLARPVHYYTDSDYAVLARKDVAETFPGVKITNQAGPVARMVQAGTDGTQSAVSAETARSTIDAAQTAHTHTVANLSNLGANWSGLLTSAKPTTLAGYGITDAQAALGYTPVNKAGDTMTGGLTLSGGDLNVGVGGVQTAGVMRISNGGAGTLTTLSTTGLATLAQATVSDIAADRIVTTTTGGRLQGDAGLTATRITGVTVTQTLGDNATAFERRFLINGPAGFRRTFRIMSAGSTRWAWGADETAESGSNAGSAWYLRAHDDGSGEIDDPISIVRVAAGPMIFGGNTLRPATFKGTLTVNGWIESDQGYRDANGVQRISSGGAGTLTTLSTTGMATVAQATVEDLPTGRMVSTTTGGRLQALDAAAARATIGAAAAFDMALLSGRVWSTRAGASPDFTHPRYSQFAYGGGVYIATDSSVSTNKLHRSTDGVSWATITLPTTGNWKGATYCASSGLFIIVGDNKILTSPNGTTWTSRTNPGSNLYGVACNGAKVIVVSLSAGGTVVSTDGGATWAVLATFPSATFGVIAYENGKWLVAGDGKSSASSDNGVTWSTPLTSMPGVGGFNTKRIAYFAGRYWLTGYADLYTCTDGVTWTSAATLFASIGWYVPVSVTAWYSIAVSSSTILVQVNESSSSAVLASRDGVYWENVFPANGPFQPSNVANFDGDFKAFGAGASGIGYTAESIAA